MKISVFKSVAVLETVVTVAMIRLLESIKPNALTLVDEDKNVLFRIAEGKEPSVGMYGLTISEKRDIILQFDKPITEEVLREKFPHVFLRLPALEAQVKAEYDAAVAGMADVEFTVIES